MRIISKCNSNNNNTVNADGSGIEFPRANKQSRQFRPDAACNSWGSMSGRKSEKTDVGEISMRFVRQRRKRTKEFFERDLAARFQSKLLSLCYSHARNPSLRQNWNVTPSSPSANPGHPLTRDHPRTLVFTRAPSLHVRACHLHPRTLDELRILPRRTRRPALSCLIGIRPRF